MINENANEWNKVYGYQCELDTDEYRRWSGGIYDQSRRGLFLYPITYSDESRNSFKNNQWNNFDINEFMKGYLNFENLVFSGKNGPIYGWDNIKERYFRAYSSKDEMGELSFEIDNIFMID